MSSRRDKMCMCIRKKWRCKNVSLIARRTLTSHYRLEGQWEFYKYTRQTLIFIFWHLYLSFCVSYDKYQSCKYYTSRQAKCHQPSFLWIFLLIRHFSQDNFYNSISSSHSITFITFITSRASCEQGNLPYQDVLNVATWYSMMLEIMVLFYEHFTVLGMFRAFSTIGRD